MTAIHQHTAFTTVCRGFTLFISSSSIVFNRGYCFSGPPPLMMAGAGAAAAVLMTARPSGDPLAGADHACRLLMMMMTGANIGQIPGGIEVKQGHHAAVIMTDGPPAGSCQAIIRGRGRRCSDGRAARWQGHQGPPRVL